MGLLSRALRWGIGFYFAREADSTLTAIRAMTPESQAMVADVVGGMVLEALGELERRPERREVLDEYLASSAALRHHAVENGAQVRTSPQWACAALAESLFVAVHPKASRSMSLRVIHSVGDWAQTVLSESDFARLGFGRLRELAG